MPKWTQNDTYQPTAQEPASAPVDNPTQPVEEPVAEAPAKKPKSVIKIVVGSILAVVLVIGIVGLCIWWQKTADDAPMNHPTETADPFGSEDDLDDFFNSFTPVFSYTDEEKRALRSWGYTGTDIENAAMAETTAQQLIDQAKADQEEARAQLSNPESPEFRALLEQTWLGEPIKEVPAYVENVTPFSRDNVTINADYERMPVHGTNLFLKVELEDGTHHFMEVSPFRYSTLNDSGNIVVTYELITIDGYTYINNMREVEVH